MSEQQRTAEKQQIERLKELLTRAEGRGLECPKCHYATNRMDQKCCGNDGTPMVGVMWRDRAMSAVELLASTREENGAAESALAEAQREIERLTGVSDRQATALADLCARHDRAESALAAVTRERETQRQQIQALREKALKFYLWLLVTRTKLPSSPEGHIEARAWTRIANEASGDGGLITLDEARAIHRDVTEGRDTIDSALGLLPAAPAGEESK